MVGLQLINSILLLHELVPVLVDLVLVVVQQLGLLQAQLPGLPIPERVEIVNVGPIHLVVLLEGYLFLLEGLHHRVDFDEQLVASLDLGEEWSVQGVPNVEEMCVAHLQDFLDGVVEVLSG